jgi:hypothetical protein
MVPSWTRESRKNEERAAAIATELLAQDFAIPWDDLGNPDEELSPGAAAQCHPCLDERFRGPTGAEEIRVGGEAEAPRPRADGEPSWSGGPAWPGQAACRYSGQLRMLLTEDCWPKRPAAILRLTYVGLSSYREAPGSWCSLVSTLACQAGGRNRTPR